MWSFTTFNTHVVNHTQCMIDRRQNHLLLFFKFIFNENDVWLCVLLQRLIEEWLEDTYCFSLLMLIMSSSHLKYSEVCDTACMHFRISLCTYEKRRTKVMALHMSTVLVCACVYLSYSRSVYLYLYIFLLLLSNTEILKLNWSKHQFTHTHTHTHFISLWHTYTHTLRWYSYGSLCIYRNKIKWLKECKQKTHKFSILNIDMRACVCVCVGACVCVCVCVGIKTGV